MAALRQFGNILYNFVHLTIVNVSPLTAKSIIKFETDLKARGEFIVEEIFMSFYLTQVLTIVLALAVVSCNSISNSGDSVLAAENLPVAESPLAAVKGEQTAVFAGGCFWGVEAVFEHTKGVLDVKSGYAGGDAKSANYDDVSGGSTAHAEAVIVTYDPSQITYEKLLLVFFSVAHDPTELNRQGPDTGPQYRSAIFYTNDEQKKSAADFIAAIEKSKALSNPVVTKLEPLVKFYDAEKYHQDYLKRNPTQPYIVIHDMPKLEDLKSRFPELYVKK